MKLPDSAAKIVTFAEELIGECNASQKDRVTRAQNWLAYYYNGAAPGLGKSTYNKCLPHIDRMSSYLFSPPDVRFDLQFEQGDEREKNMGDAAARVLSYDFHRANADFLFAAAIDIALIKGAGIIKTNWGHNGLEPSVVQPECFGVLREDINSLDRQEAFVHTVFMTPSQLKRHLENNPRKEEILKRVKSAAAKNTEGVRYDTFLHQVIIGGIQPIAPPGEQSQGMSTVDVLGYPSPYMPSNIREEIIALHELWVRNDATRDWTTIQIIFPDILIEGKDRLRNLCEVPGEQPFRLVQCNRVDGYFWGISEIAPLATIQDMINIRLDDIDRELSQNADPNWLGSGMTADVEQIKAMLKKTGGFMTEQNPGAKMQNLAPTINEQLFTHLHDLIGWFDDVAGFKPILQGQGESGIRSGVHADTLVRTASPRLRDRSLMIERQCASLGDYCLKLLAMKDPTLFKTSEGVEFLLSQLPQDVLVTIDSHSSTPAFSEETKGLAMNLFKAQAIGPVELLELTHPPQMDKLIEAAKKKQQAQAKLIQEHPELLQKGKKK